MFSHNSSILCIFLLQTALLTGPAMSNIPCDSKTALPFSNAVRALWNQYLLTNSSQASLQTLINSNIPNLT